MNTLFQKTPITLLGLVMLIVLAGCNQGNITVALAPSAAVDAGAQWRVDGGAWQDSGATLEKVNAGQHVITYKPVAGWVTPADATVSVTKQQTITVEGFYLVDGLAVPNLAGDDQAAALSALETAGLTLGSTSQACSNTVAVGVVISQAPAAGTLAPAGSAVTVVVSSGPCPVTVPDVTGQTQSAAEAALASAGLSGGTISEQCSFAVPAGSVISQEPGPGTEAASGSMVNLTVSTGACSVTVPNTLGQTQSAGQTMISAAGLVPGMVTEQCSANVAAGKIISQNPAAGASAAAGSEVLLTVSTGPCNATVPNAVGQGQSAAASSITGAGLAVGTVTQQCSGTVAAGVVISQIPPAGALATLGSAVNLTISSGACNVQVPNLVGQTQSAATALVIGAGLTIGTVAQQCSLTVASGSVISQSPAAGAQASAGSAVNFTVSNGACTVTVPDVAGQTQSAASTAIAAAGLVPGNVTQQCSFTVASGRVISQTPAGGTQLAAGGAVDLVVSTGVCSATVPDVVGDSQSAASAAITGRGLVVGTVTQQCSATVAPGSVISQNPAANASVPSGSSVNLVVSTGTCTVTVPNVTGQTQPAATAAVTGAGLVVGTVTQQCSATVASGTVISQLPAGGGSASPGSAVNLVVSTGACNGTVPTVTGQTQTAATAAVTGAGFVLGTVTQQCSNTVAPGSVISQTPAGGATATLGSAVNLVISTGGCPVTVPGVVGQTQSAATAALNAVGLVLGAVTQQCSNSVAAGLVISQTPATGATAAAGSAVNLVVSTGNCDPSVPNVVGMTQAAASSALVSAGMVLGTVAQQCSGTVSAGRVISQSPAAGTVAASGSSVSLVVSTGPCPVPVPDLAGKTQAEAAAAISAAGLIPGTVTEQCSDTVAAGHVVSQSPVKNTQVQPGSTVTLVVSTGTCKVTVPNLVNQTQAAAASLLANAFLTAGTVTQQCSDTVSQGNVISQNPAAGTEANMGSAVAIVVSTGACRATVPNLVGQSASSASATLSAAGLLLGTQTAQCSNTVSTGKIMQQVPAAGALVAPGTTVDLVWCNASCGETACANSVLSDGGFEGGTPNAFWTGSGKTGPITSSTSGGKTPHGGTYYAWFGNSTTPATATLSQTKTIPVAAAATLTFYLRIAGAGTGSGGLSVWLDGTKVGSYLHSSKSPSPYTAYTQITIDVSAYADGGSHTLAFEGGTAGGDNLNYVFTFLDDVCLSTSNPQYFPLTVSRTGAGTGTVAQADVIDCGGDCVGWYAPGTVVSLTATAAANSTFTGWTGADTATGGTCSVAMTRSRTVVATFAPKSRALNLTVATAGGASGQVTGYNINCTGTCSYTYNHGTSVTLSAVVIPGNLFTGWTGADTVSGNTCTVTLTSDKNVTASFAPDVRTLTVTRGGNGGGTVDSSVGGLNCGTACSADIATGTTVTLTATPNGDSIFTGWTGADSTTANTATVAMNTNRTVNANFTLKTHALTVAKIGGGTVTGNGVNCGGDCTETFNAGTVVTLTATPATGYIFSSWTGADSANGSTCSVTMNAAKTVTANFTAQNYTLNIAKTGSGSGTVTSGSAGINCGGDCTESYPAGTVVTLTAAPTAGSSFTAWTGADTSTGTTCTVTMNGNKTVGASFTLPNYTLTVSRAGTGGGTVTATGLNCGSDCTAEYAAGTQAYLTAQPDDNSTFTGWTGDASGTTSPYSLTMNAAKNVTATFTLKMYTLSVNKNGNGTVTSNTGGINCGSTCSGSFNAGASVQLTATPTAGFAFTGWSGDASGTANPVTVTMSSAKSVTANFTQSYTLTVSKTGNGSVASNPAGITCGTTCSATYAANTTVTLTATADTGYAFDHWTGADSSNGATCTVTMNGAKNVTATFVAATATRIQILNPSDFFIVSIILNGVQQLPAGQGMSCKPTGQLFYTVQPGTVTYHIGFGTNSGEYMYYENAASVPSGQTVQLNLGAELTYKNMLANYHDWWTYEGNDFCGAGSNFRLKIFATGAWELYFWYHNTSNNTYSWQKWDSGTLSATIQSGTCVLDPFVFKFNGTNNMIDEFSYPQISPGGGTLYVKIALPSLCNPSIGLLPFFKNGTQVPVQDCYAPWESVCK